MEGPNLRGAHSVGLMLELGRFLAYMVDAYAEIPTAAWIAQMKVLTRECDCYSSWVHAV